LLQLGRCLKGWMCLTGLLELDLTKCELGNKARWAPDHQYYRHA